MKIENRNRWTKFALGSLIIIAIALVLTIIGRGLNLGVDFTGGTIMTYNMGTDFDVNDIENAFFMLKNAGFETGLQMMTGLYGSTYEKDVQTAKRIIVLKPDTARIYPTVVLKGTYLAELYEKGEYIPMTLDETVKLCAEILPDFLDAGINVIRLGLHYSDDVKENYLAGGFHPALMELVEGEIYLNKALEKLKDFPKNKPLTLYVNEKELSKMKGQQKRNEKILINQGFCCKIKGNLYLDKYVVLIEE